MQTTDPQDEMFEIVDLNDNVIGEATRKEIHKNPDLIHRVVHIWIVNDKNEILLQQRSLTKDKAPGLWDMSCGGHVKSEDSIEITLEKELKEELGVTTNCVLVDKYLEKLPANSNDFCGSIIINMYITFHNGPFTISKDEVEQVKFFSPTEAIQFIKNDQKISYFSKKEIPIIFDYLKIKLHI